MQWSAITVLGILMGLIHSAALHGRAIRRDGAEIFLPSVVLRGAYLGGSLLFLFLGVGFTYKVGWREMGWPLLFFFAFPVLVITNWPSTIVVSKDAVTRIQPFRKTICIPRNEILAVVFDRVKLTTLVCGVNGSIEHGNYHVASEEFRRLLSRWCTVEEQ